MFEDANECHDHLGVAYRWAKRLGRKVDFNKEEEAVLATIEYEDKKYEISFHMNGDALTLGIAIDIECEERDELKIRREIDSANSTWPHGAFLFSHDPCIVIHRDSLETEEDDWLAEDDIMGLFECGVEAVQFLISKMSEYFQSYLGDSLEHMIPVGQA